MSQPHADVPPELLAEIEAALAVELAREEQAAAIAAELADVDAAYAAPLAASDRPRLPVAFAWLLVLCVLGAVALAVRVVVAPAEHLDGLVLVPVLLIGAAVLIVARVFERSI